jgi:hypothetical protein
MIRDKSAVGYQAINQFLYRAGERYILQKLNRPSKYHGTPECFLLHHKRRSNWNGNVTIPIPVLQIYLFALGPCIWHERSKSPYLYEMDGFLDISYLYVSRCVLRKDQEDRGLAIIQFAVFVFYNAPMGTNSNLSSRGSWHHQLKQGV